MKISSPLHHSGAVSFGRMALLGKKSTDDAGVSSPPADAPATEDAAVANTEPAPSKPLSLEERVAKIERHLRAQGFDAS